MLSSLSCHSPAPPGDSPAFRRKAGPISKDIAFVTTGHIRRESQRLEKETLFIIKKTFFIAARLSRLFIPDEIWRQIQSLAFGSYVRTDIDGVLSRDGWNMIGSTNMNAFRILKIYLMLTTTYSFSSRVPTPKAISRQYKNDKW